MVSHPQYASAKIQPAPTVTVSPGLGSITGSGTLYIGVQARTRQGYTPPSTLVAAPYSAGDLITVEIPSTARGDACEIRYWVVVAAATNTPANTVVLCRIQGYESDHVTPKALPLSVDLTTDAHIALSASVANLTALAALGSPLDGMRRYVAEEVDYYEYSLASLDWVLLSGAFSTYVASRTSESGCDADIRDLSSTTDILREDYDLSSTTAAPGIPINVLWSHEESGDLPSGTRMLLALYIDELNVSALLNGKMRLIFNGYVNRQTGELDTSGMTGIGTPTTYQSRKTNLRLQKPLPSGWAYSVSVYPQFAPQELLGEVVESGLEAMLYPAEQPGEYTEAGHIFGDMVYAEGDRLKVVPWIIGAKLLSGGAIIDCYSFLSNPEQVITSIPANTADQKLVMNGNGAAFLASSIAATEAQRCILGTEPGRSASCPWSSTVTLTGTEGIRITISHPVSEGFATIRANYPDPILAGLSGKARLNAPTLAIYVRVGAETRRFSAPCLEAATQVIDLDDWDAGTTTDATPIESSGAFSCFQPLSNTVELNGSSDFPAGICDVRAGYEYNGGQVTSISHASPPCLTTSSLTYAEIEAVLQYFSTPVESLSDLRGITERRRGMICVVMSMEIPFIYDTLATGADDGLIIKPSDLDVSSPGRWIPMTTRSILSVENLAALRALTPRGVRDLRLVDSNLTIYAYYPDVSDADNGGSIIKPSSVDSEDSGRWVSVGGGGSSGGGIASSLFADLEAADHPDWAWQFTTDVERLYYYSPDSTVAPSDWTIQPSDVSGEGRWRFYAPPLPQIVTSGGEVIVDSEGNVVTTGGY